jgi:Tfp pilus assembly protein PilZ
MSSGPSSSKYMVLARLFEMVDQLSEDQKFLLIKGMQPDDLTSHLNKLIIDLGEEQQLALLEQLKEMTSVEVPERTVDLDERETPRVPCHIYVDYMTQDQKYSNTIRDISPAGVFIETDDPLEVGQNITLIFSFPVSDDHLEVKGEIVWRSSKGIGVKFNDLNLNTQKRLQDYIRTI